MQDACSASGAVGAVPQARRAWQTPAASAEPSVQCSASSVQPSSDKRTVHLDVVTLLMAQDSNMVDTHSSWAQHGADAARVREVLQRGACNCGCYRSLSEGEVAIFCQRYHSLTPECQSHLLKVAYDTAAVASSVQAEDGGEALPAVGEHLARRTDWHLQGHRVCVTALVALLGQGRRTFYSRVAGFIDGRKVAAVPQDAVQSRLVDQFFLETYNSAAEHLAEEDGEEAAQYVHSEAVPTAEVCCQAWSPERSVEPPVSLPKRFLQHGRLTDLWWQFLAWFASLDEILLQCTPVSSIQRPPTSSVQCPPESSAQRPKPKRPSWSVFWRRWARFWKGCFAFRGKSQHAQCNECSRYQEYLHKTSHSPADKHQAAGNWRRHLRQQYHDRLVYWHLRWFSQQKNRSVLTIIIDSMDKSKLAWPQYSFRKPKCLQRLRRPRLVVTCAIAHGFCTAFYITDDEVTSHGASHVCEVLTRILDKVQAQRSASSIPFPEHLVVQSDNTTAQAKKSEVGQFLATLVGKYRFKTATLNFLIVGHTHEDVDLMFGILLSLVLRRRTFQVPDELVQNILIGMANHIASRGEEIVCEFVTHIRDFGLWLCPQGIKLHNAFVTRDDVEAPHSFTYKLRMDLQPDERAALGNVRHPRFPASASDVMCIVKHRMHHTSPNGPPVLILPVERRDRVITAGPTSAHVPKRGWGVLRCP